MVKRQRHGVQQGTLSKETQSHIAADLLKASYSIKVEVVFGHQCSAQYFRTLLEWMRSWDLSCLHQWFWTVCVFCLTSGGESETRQSKC